MGHAQRTADVGDFLDREHVQLRVGQRFRIVRTGLAVGGLAEVLGIGRIDEAHLDALRLQRVGEEVPGAAVKVGRADDVVAGLGDVLDRHRRGGLARADTQCRDAPFEGGDALFEHRVRRVHDAGVDVAKFLEAKEVGRMLGAAELIRRRLVDRHRDRARGRVGPIAAAMQGERLGILRGSRHRSVSLGSLPDLRWSLAAERGRLWPLMAAIGVKSQISRLGGGS
jgi:hypothetical protein